MAFVENVVIGKVNGKLSAQDAEDIALARTDYQPAVILGENTGPGQPAFGYVSGLRKVGRALVADLQDVPEIVAHALRSGRVKRIALEVYENLTRGGQKFRRALRAIRIRDLSAPSLNLKPSGVIAFAEMDGTVVHVYETSLDDDDDAGAEVDAAVREYMQRTGEKSYGEAMHAVLEEDPELYRRYAGGRYPAGVTFIPSQAEATVSPRAEAGMEIDKKVRAILNANPALQYLDVLRRVLAENRELAERYGGIRDPRLG